jgi:hypothetical protein
MPFAKPQCMDIAEVKNKLGDRICLIGNIDCAETLVSGSPDDVVTEVREALQIAAPGGGFHPRLLELDPSCCGGGELPRHGRDGARVRHLSSLSGSSPWGLHAGFRFCAQWRQVLMNSP